MTSITCGTKLVLGSQSARLAPRTTSVARTNAVRKHLLHTVRAVSEQAETSGVPTPSFSATKPTYFYGGKNYTESEWKVALEDGSLARATEPAQVSTPAATSASTPEFGEVMAFNGPAPEIVNGRLAMLGFVAAVAAELSSGESVLRQWATEPTGIFLTFTIFIAASLIPIFGGKKVNKWGPFTAGAELINGRAAMIGFAALLAIEATKGSPLF